MSQDTCAVLTAVFPLVLITVVLEQRSLHLNIRRRAWFRLWRVLTTCWAIIGLVASVIGVQLEGLSGVWALFNWLLAGLAGLGLTFVLLGALATTEEEEDAELAHQGAGQSN